MVQNQVGILGDVNPCFSDRLSTSFGFSDNSMANSANFAPSERLWPLENEKNENVAEENLLFNSQFHDTKNTGSYLQLCHFLQCQQIIKFFVSVCKIFPIFHILETQEEDLGAVE